MQFNSMKPEHMSFYKVKALLCLVYKDMQDPNCSFAPKEKGKQKGIDSPQMRALIIIWEKKGKEFEV